MSRHGGEDAGAGDDGEVVDDVGVVRPALGNARAVDVPQVLGVDPGGDVVEPAPELGAQRCRRRCRGPTGAAGFMSAMTSLSSSGGRVAASCSRAMTRTRAGPGCGNGVTMGSPKSWVPSWLPSVIGRVPVRRRAVSASGARWSGSPSGPDVVGGRAGCCAGGALLGPRVLGRVGRRGSGVGGPGRPGCSRR